MYFLIFSLFSGIAVHIRFTINLIYKVYTRNKYNKVTNKMGKAEPKKDGSGRGRRANRGRGGCSQTRKKGRGRNK